MHRPKWSGSTIFPGIFTVVPRQNFCDRSHEQEDEFRKHDTNNKIVRCLAAFKFADHFPSPYSQPHAHTYNKSRFSALMVPKKKQLR